MGKRFQSAVQNCLKDTLYELHFLTVTAGPRVKSGRTLFGGLSCIFIFLHLAAKIILFLSISNVWVQNFQKLIGILFQRNGCISPFQVICHKTDGIVSGQYRKHSSISLSLPTKKIDLDTLHSLITFQIKVFFINFQPTIRSRLHEKKLQLSSQNRCGTRHNKIELTQIDDKESDQLESHGPKQEWKIQKIMWKIGAND